MKTSSFSYLLEEHFILRDVNHQKKLPITIHCISGKIWGGNSSATCKCEYLFSHGDHTWMKVDIPQIQRFNPKNESLQ